MVIIKGLQKTCLVDFEPYMAATVFLGGCNFRCGFCHNPDLVISTKETDDLNEQEFFDFLDERKKWLDGVCITGGEPCLYEDIPIFINKIKEKGLLVKLDTNGSNPQLIEKLLRLKLLDYIAMDIKTKFENYDEVCNVKVDIEKIKQSIQIIKDSKIDYEFRTTVIPNFITKEDIIEIAKQIKGAKKYTIQNFSNKNNMINNDFKTNSQYKKEELDDMKKGISKLITEVIIKD
jgi:pyruvate formate lyase activating enzyme